MTDDSPKHAPLDRQNETPDELEKRIKDRAYQLWEAEGCREGGADAYWHRAKERVEDEMKAAYPPAASSTHRP